jgi:hypothetical protein
MLKKWLSQNFDWVTSGQMSVGGSQVALQYFGHLNIALEPLISVRMSLLRILYDYWIDAINPGRKTYKQIKTHQ